MKGGKMKKPVILDCDPGIDDAIMLFMAFANEEIDIKAITTCAGNQTPDKTFHNARNLLSLIGRQDVPVMQGAKKPLLRELIIAKEIHGDDGLANVKLEPSQAPILDEKALDGMVHILKTSKEKVTIVATGPLTNIAILLLAYPELKENIEEIVFMGGACFGGNCSPVAEFNIYVDPEACKIVLEAGVPLVMAGLDVTHKAQFHKRDRNILKGMKSLVCRNAYQFLSFYAKSIKKPLLYEKGHEEGIHMHDPTAIAYVLKPSIFKAFSLAVQVDCSDTFTRGQTLVDYNHTTKKKANVTVLMDLDLIAFKSLVMQSFSFYEHKSEENV